MVDEVGRRAENWDGRLGDGKAKAGVELLQSVFPYPLVGTTRSVSTSDCDVSLLWGVLLGGRISCVRKVPGTKQSGEFIWREGAWNERQRMSSLWRVQAIFGQG